MLYKGDIVKVKSVVCGYDEYDHDDIFLEEVGQVVFVYNDSDFPYLLEFVDKKVEKLNIKKGRFLWNEEQLEFICDLSDISKIA